MLNGLDGFGETRLTRLKRESLDVSVVKGVFSCITRDLQINVAHHWKSTSGWKRVIIKRLVETGHTRATEVFDQKLHNEKTA